MKRNTQEVTRLVRYASNATAEQLMDDYGVELLEGGVVFDAVEELKFPSITEWAKVVVGTDDEEEIHHRSRGAFDDERF